MTVPESWFLHVAVVYSAFLSIFSGVLLQEGNVSSIPLGFHVLFRNEFQGSAVDAVAQAAAFFGTVREDVAQVGISCLAADFCAVHTVGKVLFFLNQVFLDGTAEAGPSAAGIKFIRGKEQGFSRRDVHVDAGTVIVEIFVPEGRFRSVFRVTANCSGVRDFRSSSSDFF